MGITTANLAISLDGYTAGPRQSLEQPFGTGAAVLTRWMLETEAPGREADAALLASIHAGTGAHIMGRNMFSPDRGPWDPDWTGWWGPNPPYHSPVFVLTHHAREPLAMEGGTTFHFVTDGIESAWAAAKEAAGDRDIEIAGGAATVRQYLAAGRLDELVLHVVPAVLGDGESLWRGLPPQEFDVVEVIASPTVTHLRYRRPSAD